MAGAKPARTRTSRDRRRPLGEDEARRALAESKKLYYRIGEVSELTGVKAHVLRYWETEFRWMAPPKSRSKQRLYRKRDIEFVWLLKKLLWEQRYTIAGARQRIQELGLDEALTRCADAESLDASLASIGGPIAAADAASSDAEAASLDPDEAHRLALGPAAGADARVDGAGDDSAPASWDWVGLRVALESMQSELLELRGALQQGL
ncbi:MAG: MerR family transcriptional regulator [Deltaproteobacteria bacterium]|nr:MerR family transcriptional regulator [Deltaproteobacteria bacterium]